MKREPAARSGSSHAICHQPAHCFHTCGICMLSVCCWRNRNAGSALKQTSRAGAGIVMLSPQPRSPPCSQCVSHLPHTLSNSPSWIRAMLSFLAQIPILPPPSSPPPPAFPTPNASTPGPSWPSASMPCGISDTWMQTVSLNPKVVPEDCGFVCCTQAMCMLEQRETCLQIRLLPM